MNAATNTLFHFINDETSVLKTIDAATLQDINGTMPFYIGAAISLFEKDYQVVHIEVEACAEQILHEANDAISVDRTVGRYNVIARIYIEPAPGEHT